MFVVSNLLIKQEIKTFCLIVRTVKTIKIANAFLILLSVSFILQHLSKIIEVDPELCGLVFPGQKLALNLAYFLKLIPYN